MSAALLAVIGQGDAVVIDGMAGPAVGEIRAWRINNHATGRSVTEAPPPFPPEPQAWSGRDMRVAGVVRRTLTGGRGEINGVILDDGTAVEAVAVGSSESTLTTVGPGGPKPW